MFLRATFVTGASCDRAILLERDAPERLSVELRPMTADERTVLNQGVEGADTICVGILRPTLTRAIRTWLSDPTKPQPAGFTEFSDSAYTSLRIAVERALRVLRWRVGLRGAGREPILGFRLFEWSADGHAWHLLYDNSLARIVMTVGLPYSQISQEIVGSTKELWLNDVDEPPAHELFQEAWDLQESNPRSSLVIGIAAAETCVKNLVMQLVPATAWLLENLQSPPIVAMLGRYFPQLPARIVVEAGIQSVAPPPDWLIKIIEKGVNLRNKVVHGQRVELRKDTVREVLEAVNDVLYYCDLHAGHLWAASRLSPRLQAALRSRLGRADQNETS